MHFKLFVMLNGTFLDLLLDICYFELFVCCLRYSSTQQIAKRRSEDFCFSITNSSNSSTAPEQYLCWTIFGSTRIVQQDVELFVKLSLLSQLLLASTFVVLFYTEKIFLLSCFILDLLVVLFYSRSSRIKQHILVVLFYSRSWHFAILVVLFYSRSSRHLASKLPVGFSFRNWAPPTKETYEKRPRKETHTYFWHLLSKLVVGLSFRNWALFQVQLLLKLNLFCLVFTWAIFSIFQVVLFVWWDYSSES